ncbi:MAG TPA: co-chaperone GroES [Caldisericia bacterium]|jgi:chaperonin GroES|nr:MAG: 10 kDa chaperonin [bacterium ADurb.Bin132]HNY60984.1 co-chaperone GroES [Caldisericia bacterium]HOC78916.1 co-chaperone GroES [Caldisericia bacterium]HOG69703.1 co-chaperone GroES [Caldisericia bacterium]HPA65651.1 co-chaperone GroES [Caldisericia bacterium]
MNLRPLGDRVIIKPLDEEETKKGGLYIPDTAKEKPVRGEVIAVGPGKILDNGVRVPMDIKVGQKIIYAKYGGTDIKIEGDNLVILSERDLLAVVE